MRALPRLGKESSPSKILSIDESSKILGPNRSSLLTKNPVASSGLLTPVKEPYIPVTVLSINNQYDFSKISTIINGTYDATADQQQNKAIKKDMTNMQDDYIEHLKKLRANPFGTFGGSP